jgi:hypothetical protein
MLLREYREYLDALDAGDDTETVEEIGRRFCMTAGHAMRVALRYEYFIRTGQVLA